MEAIHGDFTDDHWLLLVEDEGHDGMGRVLGYMVFETEAHAKNAENHTLGCICDAFNLFVGESIPEDVSTEVMTYGDFKASYGNRMPLSNRGYAL